MKRLLWSPDIAKVSPDHMDWTITVIEPLPNCPNVKAGWEKIATQTRWSEWRSVSKMRGKNVTTSIVSPATEPLKTGDEYIVRVGSFMKICCRVIESSSPDTAAGREGEMVFDATGSAMGGLVNARFRFTVFRGEYIEGFYNTVRLHSTLGYLSPVEFEANYRKTP